MATWIRDMEKKIMGKRSNYIDNDDDDPPYFPRYSNYNLIIDERTDKEQWEYLSALIKRKKKMITHIKYYLYHQSNILEH
jgi:hypothetical protein